MHGTTINIKKMGEMLLIRINGTVEHVKRKGCESISQYSHTHKHKERALTFHELNCRVNVIKREAIFLLKENYF
jgi:hypothetical protein